MRHLYPLFILAALICAFIATTIGFGWGDMERHTDDLLGWVSAAFAFFFAGELLDLIDRP